MKSLVKVSTVIGLALSTLISVQLEAKTHVIHAGKVLTVPGKSPLSNQTIIIKDGIITNIKSGFIPTNKVDKDALLIDLSDSFVMPGLMDMHVHLQGELGPKNDSEKLRLSDSDKLVRSAYFAKKTLLAGFTTVRDLGGSAEQSFALRDGIAKGYLQGPRIIAAGTNVAVTGGHGDVDSGA